MAETFEQLLAAIGFTGADAAQQIARAGRDRDRALADVQLTGVEERRGINESAEASGMYGSGARGLDLARQAGKESARVADLNTAYADEVAGAQQAVMRAVAEENARDRLAQANRDIGDTEYRTAIDLLNSGYDTDIASVNRRSQLDIDAARRVAYSDPVPMFDPTLIPTRRPTEVRTAWDRMRMW